MEEAIWPSSRTPHARTIPFCWHGITIEVYRKAGPISESGVVINEANKRAKKKMGLPERHAICKPAPSDELGEWAQEFCRQSA